MKQYTSITQKKAKQNQIKVPFDSNGTVSSVFLNGDLQTESQDYLIENDRIVFPVHLNEDDELIINTSYETNKGLINPGKSSKNSIISRYNDEVKLSENNKYTIGIIIDNDEYKWSFNSKQNPMFTTSKKIFEDIGEFIEGFTEEYINNKIYDNSLEVIDLIDELASRETPIENVTYEQDENGMYTSSYRAVDNWVRYKTDIDLTIARYFGISYNYGTKIKEIGDIKIEKTTKLPYIDNLLEALRKKFDLADQAIRGVNTVASAVKAGNQYKYDDWDRDTTW